MQAVQAHECWLLVSTSPTLVSITLVVEYVFVLGQDGRAWLKSAPLTKMCCFVIIFVNETN